MISKNKIKQKGQIYLMLSPNLILFFTLSVYPIIWVIRFMFYQYGGPAPVTDFLGLDNFRRIFTKDQSFWKSVIIHLSMLVVKFLVLHSFFQL